MSSEKIIESAFRGKRVENPRLERLEKLPWKKYKVQSYARSIESRRVCQTVTELIDSHSQRVAELEHESYFRQPIYQIKPLHYAVAFLVLINSVSNSIKPVVICRASRENK